MEPLPAPGPPNSSDEDVSCTAPATENASLQILFKCPTLTLAIVFGNAAKPSRFAHFCQGPQSLAPATRNDIWTSKSGPRMVCFVHFDFEMCFAPQRRALFRHRNFQKWSENGVLYILTSKCASRHNGVDVFISHLARWLRTRHFSEPTFRSGATNHWKNTVFGDFPTFSRTWIFFLLRLSLSSSLLFSDSSHLCFSSVHIVGSLTSKLPSIILYNTYLSHSLPLSVLGDIHFFRTSAPSLVAPHWDGVVPRDRERRFRLHWIPNGLTMGLTLIHIYRE